MELHVRVGITPHKELTKHFLGYWFIFRTNFSCELKIGNFMGSLSLGLVYKNSMQGGRLFEQEYLDQAKRLSF